MKAASESSTETNSKAARALKAVKAAKAAILMTVIGYLSADYLNKEMLIGLAIVNPVYFFCMMIGAMKNLSISIAVIGGTVLGPVIYLISTEWALLFAGLIAGTIAFLVGEFNG